MEHRRSSDRRPIVLAKLPALSALRQPNASCMPGWELEFSCHGEPFRCFVRAMQVRSAESEARLELSYHHPDFDSSDARLVRAVQVSS